MPKTRRHEKKGLKSTPVRVAHKIGSRKSAKSANGVPTAELLKEYFSTKRGRDKATIAKVLRIRNVTIPASLEAAPSEAQ